MSTEPRNAEVPEVAANTTNPFAIRDVMLSKKLGLTMSERIAIVGREILCNAIENGATQFKPWIWAKDNKKYFTMISDALPFASLDYLIDCLHLSTSGGNTGVQGSGMKKSAFLIGDFDKAELIVHSRSDKGSFSARMTHDKSFNSTVEAYPEFDDQIRECMGRYYNDFNVYVLYRLSDEWDKSFTEKDMAILTDWAPREGIEISYIPNGLILDDQKSIIHTLKDNQKRSTYEDLIFTNQSTRARNLFTPSEIRQNFVIDSAEFFVSNVKIPNKELKGIRCNAKVTFEVYPGFRNAQNRLITIDPLHQNFGHGNTYIDVSPETVYVYYDKETVKRHGIPDKNLGRLHTDPVWTTSQNTKLLNEISMFVQKNVQIPLVKLAEYESIANWPTEVVDKDGEKFNPKDSIKTWNPMIKMRIELCDHTTMKNCSFHHLAYYFGGLTEFFNCEDNAFMREIVTNILAKLEMDDAENLEEFRNRVNAIHFPYERTKFLPLPKIVVPDANVMTLYKDDVPLKKVSPGEIHRGLVARYKDGEEVTKDIVINTPGFELRRDAEGLTLDVKNLGRYTDKSMTTGEFLKDESEYRHSSLYYPKKYCTADVGDSSYRFTFVCKIPPQDKTGAGTSGRQKTVVHHIDRSGENYFHAEDHPKEYGMFSARKGLQINALQAEIHRIITTPQERYSKIASDWEEIYRQMDAIARYVHNEFLPNIEGCRYKKECQSEMKKNFEDEDSYILNGFFSRFFKTSDLVSTLMGKIDKIESKSAKQDIKDAEIVDDFDVADVAEEVPETQGA